MSESLDQFMLRYGQAANSRDFDEVAPMIASDAIFIFTDGTYTGIDVIRGAFLATWQHIQQETYTISNLQWVANLGRVAVCTYHFQSDGIVGGIHQTYEGQGTNVLIQVGDSWQIVHEHLSKLPSDV